MTLQSAEGKSPEFQHTSVPNLAKDGICWLLTLEREGESVSNCLGTVVELNQTGLHSAY